MTLVQSFIAQGDCTDPALMTYLLATGYDSLLTDPPYSPHVHASARSNGTAGAGVRKRDLGFACIGTPLMSALANYGANARRWSVVFTDHESTYLWREAFAEERAKAYVRTVALITEGLDVPGWECLGSVGASPSYPGTGHARAPSLCFTSTAQAVSGGTARAR